MIGLTNKISPYSMLIDAFKEMTAHPEGHCIIEDINDIGSYVTKRMTESKRKTQNLLKTSPNQDKRSMISVALPSSKIRKNTWNKTLFSLLIVHISLT